MSSLRTCLMLSFLLASGCGDDAGTAGDASVADLATARDLSARDLAAPADTAMPGQDLTASGDLAGAPDQAAPDLAIQPDLVAPPDLTQVGGACGCGGGQFCKYAVAFSCAGAGMCLQRPQICNKILDPVCGCDGVTYDNECVANAAGTDISKKGGC